MYDIDELLLSSEALREWFDDILMVAQTRRVVEYRGTPSSRSRLGVLMSTPQGLEHRSQRARDEVRDIVRNPMQRRVVSNWRKCWGSVRAVERWKRGVSGACVAWK